MILSIEHEILASDPDLETCERHVRLFFEKSQLVHYDSIEIDRSRCMNAAAPQFENILEEAVARNREVLSGLLAKLLSLIHISEPTRPY